MTGKPQEDLAIFVERSRLFGYQLVALSGDPDGVDHLLQRYIDGMAGEFGAVAAVALRLIVTELLEPLLQAADDVGSTLRADLRALASTT